MKRGLPAVALVLCNLCDAWIVGSAALKDPPRRPFGTKTDVDIMIPWRNWPDAAAHVPTNARPTSFGGWRWDVTDRLSIDMWPDTLDRLASMHFFTAAWHPRSGARLILDAP